MTPFSRRLAWETPHNVLSRRLDELRAEGPPLLDLTVSNPTRVGLRYPEDAIRAALSDPAVLRYDPSPQGLPSARAAVAGYYERRGHPVDADRLLLTASTSEAYALLFKLLCDPGDSVLVPSPSYPLFDFLGALESVALEPYPLAFDPHRPHRGAWHLDIAALQQFVEDADDPSLRAILLVNPNNPTGSFLKRDERDALIALAAEHDLAIVSDEVFADYAFGPDPRRVDSLVGEREALCFCLSGLSKVVGLPQLKLGWIHVGGPEPLASEALARLELIADTYLSVGAPVQVAAPSLLSLQPEIGGAIAARTRENLAALQQSVAGTACDVLPVEGGWYAIVRLPAILSDEAWALALLETERVIVQPGYFYDFEEEAHLVVSLLPEPDRFADGARRIVSRVEKVG